jgi:ferredoxin
MPPGIPNCLNREDIMAYKIISSSCTACAACETECPNDAIKEKNGLFIIKADLCSECIGHYDDPQCLAACPSDGTVVIDKSVPRYKAA